MFLKCNDCGAVFNEDNLGHRSDNVGEFWGSPAYMDVEVCPACGSEEIDEIGEDEFDESELWEGEE